MIVDRPSRFDPTSLASLKTLVSAGIRRLGLVSTAYSAASRVKYARDAETKARNERFTTAGAPDGLPLPAPHLVFLVAGHYDLETFYRAGVEHAELIRTTLSDAGFDVADFRSLLDFGCGCGRVTRHWADLERTEVHGSDYNPRLVDWCAEALPFAHFRPNGLTPPTDYDSEAFDFIYAISVFTHLPEELQRPWMEEMTRLLSPRGVLLVTTKGASRLEALDEAERRRFAAGQLVVQESEYAGTNVCAAFHPESYVREQLAPDLHVVAFVPAGDAGSAMTQDVFVLQKA